MDPENEDTTGLAGNSPATGGSTNEPAQVTPPEDGGQPKTPPSSGEPPAGEPESMEAAIRRGLASLDEGGKKKEPQPGEEGADGDPLKKAKEGDPALKGKPGEKPGEQDEKYRMPEGISEQAQHRFSRLASENKELTSKVQEFESIAQEQAQLVTGFRDLFNQNHVQPQELDRFCNYIKSFKTGDFETAGQLLRQQVALFEQMTGQRFEAADPLGQHPDLRQAVDAMQITEEHALELARGRARDAGLRQAGARQAQDNERRRTEQEEGTRYQQAMDKALVDIRAFSDEMRGKDIDWKAKQDILAEKVQRIVEQNPTRPDQWLGQIQDYYETMSRAARAAAGKGGGRGPQPLDSGGKGGGGRQTAAAGDMLSAIKGGLGYNS